MTTREQIMCETCGAVATVRNGDASTWPAGWTRLNASLNIGVEEGKLQLVNSGERHLCPSHTEQLINMLGIADWRDR